MVALVEALASVPVLRSAGGRDMLLELVQERLGGLSVRNDLYSRLVLVELVRRCAAWPGGLVALDNAIQFLAPGEPGRTAGARGCPTIGSG